MRHVPPSTGRTDSSIASRPATADVLVPLLADCRRAAAGFQWAANHAADSELRHRFSALAAERRHFADELVAQADVSLERLSQPLRDETWRHAWLSLKDVVAGVMDVDLVAEVMRLEERLANELQGLLNGPLSDALRHAVAAQATAVGLSRAEFADWRPALKPAAAHAFADPDQFDRAK